MGASSRWRLFLSFVSLERRGAGGTVAHRWGGGGVLGHRRYYRGFRSLRLGLILGHVVQKRRRRHEKQISRDSPAEVEKSVIIAEWATDEHVLEHLLNGPWRTAVADEIGAKLTMPGPAERHVVAQDLDLFPVLDDRGERVVS